MQTKRIPLRNRNGDTIAEAIVDKADHAELSAYGWHIEHGYAVHTATDGSRHPMHRKVLDLAAGDGTVVDHINRDPLDNRRVNLRVGSYALNSQNQGARRKSSSKYRGVSWCKTYRKWAAGCMLEGKQHNLGRFDSEEEAAAVASAFRAQHMPFSDDAKRVA